MLLAHIPPTGLPAPHTVILRLIKGAVDKTIKRDYTTRQITNLTLEPHIVLKPASYCLRTIATQKFSEVNSLCSVGGSVDGGISSSIDGKPGRGMLLLALSLVHHPFILTRFFQEAMRGLPTKHHSV